MSSPTLTKKDFERIAETLRDLQGAVSAILEDESDKLTYDNDGVNVRLVSAATPRIAQAFRNASADIAEVIAKTNGKFEPVRFLSSCEVQ